MGVILHTNVAGVFLFRDDGALIEHKLFDDPAKYSGDLKEGKWIKPEEQLLKKVKGKVFYAGIKVEEKKGIVQDSSLINKLQLIKFIPQIREANRKVSSYDFKESYSEDTVVIHAIRSYDEIDHVSNTLTMRFLDFVKLRNPASLQLDAKVDPVGFPIEEQHIERFEEFRKSIAKLRKELERFETHIETTMKKICPNVLGVAGTLLGARLMAMAGSLRQMAMRPYSTLQLYGAEKAMFRHLRKGAKSPKHGIILMHQLVAQAKNKGRAARMLAEAITKAARIDYFKGKDQSKELMEHLMKRL